MIECMSGTKVLVNPYQQTMWDLPYYEMRIQVRKLKDSYTSIWFLS